MPYCIHHHGDDLNFSTTSKWPNRIFGCSIGIGFLAHISLFYSIVSQYRLNLHNVGLLYIGHIAFVHRYWKMLDYSIMYTN